MIRFVSLAAFLACAGLASQPVNAQQKLPPVAEVLDNLKDKRERYGVQRYKLEFENTIYKNGQTGGSCRWANDFQIDWRTGKFRDYGWNACMDKPYEQIRVFDGEKIKTQFRDVTKDGKPIGDGAWKYGIGTGRRGSWGGLTEWKPVFFHKGSIAGLDDHYYDGRLLLDPDEKAFFVDSEITKDGRKLLSLKTPLEFSGNPPSSMQYEYVIDPRRDHSVVAMTYYRDGKTYYSFDIDVAEGKQPDRWILKGWTLTFHNPNGSAEQTFKVKVAEFAEETKVGGPNPFDIIPPEGAKVGRSHHTVTRDARGEWDFKLIPFEYEVKNGKLIQTSGQPLTPEWWVTDHWYQIAREVVSPAVPRPRQKR